MSQTVVFLIQIWTLSLNISFSNNFYNFIWPKTCLIVKHITCILFFILILLSLVFYCVTCFIVTCILLCHLFYCHLYFIVSLVFYCVTCILFFILILGVTCILFFILILLSILKLQETTCDGFWFFMRKWSCFPLRIEWPLEFQMTHKLICYIIAEGFIFLFSFFVLYILPFGLVRLRTFRLRDGFVRCTHWVQEFTHERAGCDNHRCHYKNPRWEMRLGTRMTSCPEAMDWGFWNLKKKLLVEILRERKEIDFRCSLRPDQ